MKKFERLTTQDMKDLAYYMLQNCSSEVIEGEILEAGYDWDDEGEALLISEIESFTDEIKDIVLSSI